MSTVGRDIPHLPDRPRYVPRHLARDQRDRLVLEELLADAGYLLSASGAPGRHRRAGAR